MKMRKQKRIRIHGPEYKTEWWDDIPANIV